MGVLLSFSAGESAARRSSTKRTRPRGDDARGEIVIFTGVRIERMVDEPPAAEAVPKPRRRRTPPEKLAGQ